MRKLGLNGPTRHRLEQVVKRSKNVRELKRAQALLWVDEGEGITQVAKRLCVTRQSIYNWLEWLKERKGRIVERLKDAGRSGRPRSKSAVVDKELGCLLETAPSEFGYQAIGWTNPLLRQHFSSSYDLKVSHQTIREAIGRVGYRWKRPRYVLSRRPKHWRQAKGGSKKD